MLHEGAQGLGARQSHYSLEVQNWNKFTSVEEIPNTQTYTHIVALKDSERETVLENLTWILKRELFGKTEERRILTGN